MAGFGWSLVLSVRRLVHVIRFGAVIDRHGAVHARTLGPGPYRAAVRYWLLLFICSLWGLGSAAFYFATVVERQGLEL
jgi:hypothetical protein